MFKQLVSQLSLSPSAASQLTFYARRLKQERITRTFSAIAAALLIGLQTAVLAPPTPSNAASSGDIILGGFVSKDDLLNRYDSSAELQNLYNYMGITRDDIARTTKVQINTKDHSLKSIGRNQHRADDFEVTVGPHAYWMQPLFDWDTGSNVINGSYYDVLAGQRKDGSYFAVMFRCGNIVTKTYPVTPTPLPKPPTPVPTAAPTPTPTPAPTQKPKPTLKPTPVPSSVACSYLLASPASGKLPLKVKFTGAGTGTGQSVSAYLFDFGDGTAVITSPTAEVLHTYTTAGTYAASVKIKGSSGAASSAVPACAVTVTSQTPPAAFTKAKSATNLTQNVDATTAAARAGDVIKYHLTTKNTGGTASSYAVVEHIEDVLEYADPSDLAGANLKDGVLSWKADTVAAGQVLSKEFTVKIKDPIPATPVSLSDANSFDLRLDNVYGNAVQIRLEPPAPKQIEAAAASLPATGAPVATFIVTFVCAMSLFFYFRNRQLIREIKLLRGEYQGGLR